MKVFKNIWFIPLVVFSLILGIAIFITVTDFVSSETIKNLALNIIAEIVIIFLVLILIERAVARNKEKERRRIENIAFKLFAVPLHKQIKIFFDIYKSSVKKKPQIVHNKMEEFFNAAFYSNLRLFDFYCAAPIIDLTNRKIDWWEYLSNEFNSFKEFNDKILFKYSYYFDTETIILIEKLNDSHFLGMLISYSRIARLQPVEHNFFNHLPFKSELKTYLELLVKLVNLYNKKKSKEDRALGINSFSWDNSISPKIGSSRISLPSMKDKKKGK